MTVSQTHHILYVRLVASTFQSEIARPAMRALQPNTTRQTTAFVRKRSQYCRQTTDHARHPNASHTRAVLSPTTRGRVFLFLLRSPSMSGRSIACIVVATIQPWITSQRRATGVIETPFSSPSCRMDQANELFSFAAIIVLAYVCNANAHPFRACRRKTLSSPPSRSLYSHVMATIPRVSKAPPVQSRLTTYVRGMSIRRSRFASTGVMSPEAMGRQGLLTESSAMLSGSLWFVTLNVRRLRPFQASTM